MVDRRCRKNVASKYIDGVFFDALLQVLAPSNKKQWGKEKYDAIEQGLKDLIKETRERIGVINYWFIME